MLTAIAITGNAPYKTVLTHGYVVDLEGKKMSKSLGNVLDPHDIINSLGADILRLWVAAIDYRSEIHASHEIFKRTAETYRRLRNTARFLLANIYDFVPEQHLLPPEQLLALDYWAVSQARCTQEEIIQAYDAYKFHLVYQKLHNFCITDMGGFYLDVIKDRQYTMPKDSKGRRSAQTAMYHIIHAMTRWLAPILSFTAEEIWQHLPHNAVTSKSSSVFLTRWYEQIPELQVQPTMNQNYWAMIRQIRDVVNKEIEIQRNAGQLGSSLEAEVTIYCDGAIFDALRSLGTELCFVLISAEALVLPLAQKPNTAINTNLAEVVWLSITVSNHAKCERCWHRVASVGLDAAHPGLCLRCITNVVGDGELRQYA